MGIGSSSPLSITVSAIQSDKYGSKNLYNQVKVQDSKEILKALQTFMQKTPTANNLRSSYLLYCIFAIQISKLLDDLGAYKGNKRASPSNQYTSAVDSSYNAASAQLAQYAAKYLNGMHISTLSNSDLDNYIAAETRDKRMKNESSVPADQLNALGDRAAAQADSLVAPGTLAPANARATFAILKAAETQLNFEPDFGTKAGALQKIQAAQQKVVALLADMNKTNW